MATNAPNPPTLVRNPADHLECYGHSRLWTDPDYLPYGNDAELPMLSTIGRGPRGEGIIIEVEQTEDSFELIIRSDLTGEVICQSGNLFSGVISIRQPDTSVVPGAQSIFYVDVTTAGITKSYPVIVNPGAQGSRIYVMKSTLSELVSSVYYVDLSDLCYYGDESISPRTGDCVMATIRRSNGSYLLGAGTITAVSDSKATILMRLLMPSNTPYIKNGNWWIGDTDTGYSVSGVSTEEVKEIVEEVLGDVLADRDLLTKEEITDLIDDKIDKLNYYISQDGRLIKEIRS